MLVLEKMLEKKWMSDGVFKERSSNVVILNECLSMDRTFECCSNTCAQNGILEY